jgi:hypothetical protein
MSTLSHLHEILEKCQSRIAAIHEIDEDIKMIAAIAERQIQLESWEVPHRPRPTTEANQDTAQAADQPVRHNLSQTPPAKQKKSQKQQHTPLTIPSKRGSTHNELRESLVISTPQGNTKPQSVPQPVVERTSSERRRHPHTTYLHQHIFATCSAICLDLVRPTWFSQTRIRSAMHNDNKRNDTCCNFAVYSTGSQLNI